MLRQFNLLVNTVLLLTVPVTLLYPQGNQSEVPPRVQKVNLENQQAERSNVPSYDEIMHLLDDLESGELEKRCNANDLDKINQYLAFLAQEGVLPDNSEESLSLQDDIEELLNGEENPYQYAVYHGAPADFMIASAVFYGHGDVVLCKNWVQKQWKNTKKFCKKHKKSIIIGAAVVVAAAAIIIAVIAAPALAPGAAAAAGAAGAASAAGSDNSNAQEKEENSCSAASDAPPPMLEGEESPTLKLAIDHEIASFKENIAEQKFFNPIEFSDHPQSLSWEENGRTLGSLFAHDSLNNLQDQISGNPKLAQEIQEMEFKYDRFMPEWNKSSSTGHPEIDRRFSTDYTYLYANPGQEADFNTLSYQIKGERALEYGYLTQAVQDLGKAIELSPESPIPYLERGVAYFGLGQYDLSLEDYRVFTSQSQKIYPLEVTDFSLGFAKGLPKGAYESGEGLVLLLADFVTHPIHTSGQLVNSVTMLVNLVHDDEWGVIAESLSPELHQLVSQWDTLPSDERGELLGYAVGKHGADILVPGGLAKIASRSMKSAQELVAVCKNLKIAQETLVLETASGIGNSAKIAEIIQTNTITIAQRLGFNAREVAQIENIGKIELRINNVGKNIPNTAQDINFADHALQRAVERGVSRESILDAIASPLKIEEVRIDNLGRPSQRFIGKKAEVVINPETQQVVSVNPTSTKKFEKLNNELSNVRDRAE